MYNKKFFRIFQELLELKKKYPMFLPKKCMKIIKKYYEGRDEWECKVFDKFLAMDNLGRVSGCRLQEPFTDIFNLKDFWHSKRAEGIRIKSKNCKRCIYTCYITYSLPITDFLDPILTEMKINLKRVLKSFFHS